MLKFPKRSDHSLSVGLRYVAATSGGLHDCGYRLSKALAIVFSHRHIAHRYHVGLRRCLRFAFFRVARQYLIYMFVCV